MRVHADVPGTRNWNEGTFAKTALLRNRPFVSSRYLKTIVRNFGTGLRFTSWRRIVIQFGGPYRVRGRFDSPETSGDQSWELFFPYFRPEA